MSNYKFKQGDKVSLDKNIATKHKHWEKCFKDYFGQTFTIANYSKYNPMMYDEEPWYEVKECCWKFNENWLRKAKKNIG